MIEFVEKYGYNVYSQNGEDGVLWECAKRMKKLIGISVEFGAPDEKYCSNTFALSGWTRYLFDSNPYSDTVQKMMITAANVNNLPECDLMSIDIDGNDYEVWKAYEGKPAIVIIEINSSLDPSIEFFHPDRGASYITMLRLGEEKGYFLLCHTGNMVFVSNEYKHLFPEIGDPYDIHKFFDKKWLLQPA